MKIQKLKESLLALHLKTMAEILDETLKKGTQENLSAADLLLILTSQEMASREQRRVQTRLSQANFPVTKTIFRPGSDQATLLIFKDYHRKNRSF